MDDWGQRKVKGEVPGRRRVFGIKVLEGHFLAYVLTKRGKTLKCTIDNPLFFIHVFVSYNTLNTFKKDFIRKKNSTG